MNTTVIWSIEHNTFWRSNRCGYTDNPAKAGRYTATEATEIVDGAYKQEEAYDEKHEFVVAKEKGYYKMKFYEIRSATEGLTIEQFFDIVKDLAVRLVVEAQND